MKQFHPIWATTSNTHANIITLNFARFSSSVSQKEAIEDVDDGFRLKVLRTMEENTFSQKGHVEFENSLGPKFFGNFDLVKDMLKFVASWTFISFVCSFGGVGKDQRWCNCWYFERFVPNKNPGIVIVHDTCTVTAGYVDVDTLLQLGWWFTLGLLLGWKNIWIQLLGSPPHLLTLPSVKLTANNFLGRFRLHLDTFILSECVESTNDDFVLVLHTWK